MDTVITKARELGKAIQADPRYKDYVSATIENEQDLELQKLIAEFENSRNELNAELQKEEKDTGKVKELDEKVKDTYHQIFASETMNSFTVARNELQEMLTFVNYIITASSNGENPDTIDEADCTGSCSTCAGC